MGSKSKTRWKDLTLGGVAGLLLSVPALFMNGFFEPRPYNVVDVDHVKYTSEDEISILATFVKTEDCDFQDLKVYGEYLGAWEELPWTDPEGSKGDRFAGYNTLSILAHTDGTKYSKVEVRTRHLCNGKKVDETFLSEVPTDEY